MQSDIIVIVLLVIRTQYIKLVKKLIREQRNCDVSNIMEITTESNKPLSCLVSSSFSSPSSSVSISSSE